ncbi:hypothetical protein HU200_057429 [Digitaria exilis]|uniref:Fucosyltransferase n=1 Tax=Digitaria exilis TaxID=1010633 RepID=A0A835E1I2_9POAL|nr:hypothetical protein HU200_057429 [Digitaria exilis]
MEAKTKKEKPIDVKRWSRAATVLAVVVMTAPPVVVLLGGRNFGAPGVWIQTAVTGLRKGSSDLPLHHTTPRHNDDRLLGGLLVDGFDEESCHSRYQYAMYRRNPGRRPSRYLVSKLRRHEALQRRCGPGTTAYTTAIDQLRSGNNKSATSLECRYIVSLPYQGLGNRILAAASAFLYALLTERVLLIDPSHGMDALFCEPFLGATWMLPPGFFPLQGYASFTNDTAETYGNMLRNKVIGAATQQMPAFAYVYLHSEASAHDKSFFWDEDHGLLRRIQWLVMRTDNYIVPGLFLAEAFRVELDKMFPEPDAIFHHLGRYLFHPNNHVWGLVTRYYDAYLADAAELVGIQVRVFGAQPNSPELLEQITKCTQNHGRLLPALLAAGTEPGTPESRRGKTKKAVLVTSLKSWYYEKLKGMYWENATSTGETVGVHQPSHEEYQRFGVVSHDAKAWAEMYLLSLSDALVTTSQSTFGYVAQGLGGLRPWVMYRPAYDVATVPDPLCGRAVSMEPCFFAAPNYNVWEKQWFDASTVVPHAQSCADFPWGGLMLVGRLE